MAKAVICPVCKGTGRVSAPLSEQSTAAPVWETCHGCNGKGWVEVQEDKTDYVSYPWYPNQPYYPWYYDHWTVCSES